MQKISDFIHFLFVQNAEIIKLNLQIPPQKKVSCIAKKTFIHNIQDEMLILTFAQLPKITITKLTKHHFCAIICVFPAVLCTLWCVYTRI